VTGILTGIAQQDKHIKQTDWKNDLSLSAAAADRLLQTTHAKSIRHRHRDIYYSFADIVDMVLVIKSHPQELGFKRLQSLSVCPSITLAFNLHSTEGATVVLCNPLGY